MTTLPKFFPGFLILIVIGGPACAQIGGPATGPSHSPLKCTAAEASAPELRPEGYAELLGDIVITCTGGSAMAAGTPIPTVDLTVSLSPFVPFTSRILNTSTGLSEALLIIDEPGSEWGFTLAKGSYGPTAPQLLCPSKDGCPAYAGLDFSGLYSVASSSAAAGGPNAANVYQGYVGASGTNSVTFYHVPILPPAQVNVFRSFRITNLRAPAPGVTQFEAMVSTSSADILPLSAPTPIVIGTVGPATTATVNQAPIGGQGPFSQCSQLSGPTLAAQISFTEGFGQGFKTRSVPMTNTAWASTLPNMATLGQLGQNIPGSLWGGFWQDNESSFILPAASSNVSGVTYTAGLADFGTRLKAVFTNIPAGVTLYVSNSNSASYAVPGGTSFSPYAVLVANTQTNEATPDGAILTPLSGTATGTDGLTATVITPDASGAATAVWEVVNTNPDVTKRDTLTFSVYVNFGGVPDATGQAGIISNVALSLAPLSGAGGVGGTVPAFSIVTPQEGQWLTIASCQAGISAETPDPFVFVIGEAVPPSQTIDIATRPANLQVTAVAEVTTPSQGSWLSVAVQGDRLTVSANPAGLAASPVPYSGNIQLSAPGVESVLVPVTLQVFPQPALSVTATHQGDFTFGQTGATYTIKVSNAAGASPTSGEVDVTEQIPAGLSLVSISGPFWACVRNVCYRDDSLPAGSSYPPITATVNVAPDLTSPQVNSVTVRGGASATASATDSTRIVPPPASSILVMHSGYFTQGQAGATYTITVHNPVASPPTSGIVTVTEIVPASFSLVSITGAGWTCAGSTCTRSDSLPPGATYPPITATVNVGANAPANVIDQATVSGGGFAPTTGGDPTLVNSSTVNYLITTYLGGSPTATAAVATGSFIGQPVGLAADLFGNIYFSTGNFVFKLDAIGRLTRVAGTGLPGFSGDGGPAVEAELWNVSSLAVDPAGNLYLVDSLNNRVREVSHGIIRTVAGTGVAGYSGDGGPATSAQLDPGGLAIDSAGNLYIVDFSNNRIRKVANGVISTIAGGGSMPGDQGPATEAVLQSPGEIAVDSSGNLFIAETGTNRIREVSQGVIRTVAEISDPTSVALDSSGNLYVSESFGNLVVEVSSSGVTTTVAGTGSFGQSGDGGPGTLAELGCPSGLAVGANGSLFIADQCNDRIRALAPSGTISTVAGNGTTGGTVGGTAALPRLSGPPTGVAIGPQGDLYAALGSGVIDVTPAGQISTVATPGICCQIQSEAVDNKGNIYVASNATVYRIAPGGAVTTVAGNGNAGPWGDGGPATVANLGSELPGLAVDRAGDLYISDKSNNAVRKVTPDGNIDTVTNLQAVGLAVDTAGNLYIGNSYTIQLLTPGGLLSTYAGGGAGGDGGPATSAQLTLADQVAVDSTGALFIGTARQIREVSPIGIISTIAGTGTGRDSSDGEPALQAGLNTDGMAVDAMGNVFMADAFDDIIRVLQPVALEPLLLVSCAHAGDFQLGQQSATYFLRVSNAASAANTNGTVTVTDTIPSGQTLVSMTGTGWSCTNNVCTSNSVLAGGASLPPITVSVDVSPTAASQVTNLVSVTGGGAFAASAIDITLIGPATPVLAIAVSQSGGTTQGELGFAAAVVANEPGAASTSGPIMVTESLPPGYTLLSMTGNGWACSSNSCTRNDSLAGGTAYDPIAITFAVPDGAPPAVVNQISASGGGSAGALTTVPTTVAAFTCDVNGDGATNVVDAETMIDELLGYLPTVHTLTHGTSITLADIQKSVNAMLGMGCPY